MKVPVPQYYYALLNVLLRLKDYGYSGNVIFQRGRKETQPQDLVEFYTSINDLFGETRWQLANNLISGSAKALFNKVDTMNYGIILESGSGGTKCAICFRDSRGLIWQCLPRERISITEEEEEEGISQLQAFVDKVRMKCSDAPLAIVFSGGFVSTYDDPIRKNWILANNALSPALRIPKDLEINSGEITLPSNTNLTLQEICQQREAEHEYQGLLAVFTEYETQKAQYDNIVFVGMGGGTVQCCVNGDYKSEVTTGIEGFNLKKGLQGNYVDKDAQSIFVQGDKNNICILSSTCFHIVDKQVFAPNLRLGLSTDQEYDIDAVVTKITEKLRACFGLQ